MREVMLILHFIGLTMGLGTGFAHAFLGSITPKMAAGEATKFRLHSLVLSKMGNAGIVLLLISGTYLLIPYWPMFPSLPLLVAKLILVIILIVLIALINVFGRKAMKGDDTEGQFKKMEKLGKMTLLIGLAIVILAVNVFH
jgi:uncharacterized membrane protein